jgi:hypothetical protein
MFTDRVVERDAKNSVQFDQVRLRSKALNHLAEERIVADIRDGLMKMEVVPRPFPVSLHR